MGVVRRCLTLGVSLLLFWRLSVARLRALPPSPPEVSFASAANCVVGSQPISVAVGDFNGDGKPDFAVTNNVSNNLSILLDNGTGAFLKPLAQIVTPLPTVSVTLKVQ